MTDVVEHGTVHGEHGPGPWAPRPRGLLMRAGLVRAGWCAALFFLVGMYIVVSLRWLAGWDPVYDWNIITSSAP